jgi:pyrroline-5-carboxylate reductase
MSEAYESQQLPRVAMLGVGSMGGAILAGLRAQGVSVDGPITVTTRSAASAEAYAGSDDVVAYANETDPDANRKAVRGARVVMLAVKPWMIHDVLTEVSADLAPGTIVVSVAAGVTTESMEQLVSAGVAVVRAMPNTPSTVGLGVTGVAGGVSASAEAVALVARIFETVGEAIVVREDQINAVAAVSGSGPAYLFLYTEEMTAAAMRLGFDEDQARLLAQQTVIGSAELLRQSGEDPAELRRKVTSPKGTTEQAILVMQEANLGDIYDRALAANVRRSEELAAEGCR